MKQKGLYKAALYCRLSQDDGLVGDSSSIQTQKMMLEKYANDNGIIIVDYYIDDGYSGTNFDRPAFPRMIADIDDEKVNMVITKDLSRLGRDYVRTGYYIDFYFKDKDIRYIAINDNVDTLYENNDIAPFKNILNEMYAKDTSRKVKTAKKLLMQKGLYMAAQPPYGYKKDPNDKNHLVIDEEAAKVVKLIFDLVLSNMGISTIAKELNKRCVPIPSVYKASKGYQCYQTLLDSRKLKYNDDDVEKWSTATVGNILRNQMYVGDMVGNKREIKNYRTGKQIIHTKDEYIVIPNTHEPIISREDFEKVQKQVSNKHRPSKTNHENIFRGILKCANCGRSMTMYHKVLANGKVVWRYRCMGKTIRHGIDTESNIIKYDDIYNVVFKRLKELFNSIKKDDDSFINDLISRYLPDETGLDKKIREAMNYSVNAGGKRVRPMLMLEVYKLCGGDDCQVVYPFMAALECIHSYSLVHDDLPAMDNDDYRRGRLTTHKVFGEDFGILAGDGLLNLAYEIMAEALISGEGDMTAKAKAMEVIARKAGIKGMVGGQAVDVELTGKALSDEQLDFIFRLKTGALIEAAFLAGAYLAGCDEKSADRLCRAASLIGFAFQIRDDILDVTSSLQELGKPVFSDEKNNKTTYVTLYGMEKAEADVQSMSDEALDIIKSVGKNEFLEEIVLNLIHRNK